MSGSPPRSSVASPTTLETDPTDDLERLGGGGGNRNLRNIPLALVASALDVAMRSAGQCWTVTP
jgi:hypothetical protein